MTKSILLSCMCHAQHAFLSLWWTCGRTFHSCLHRITHKWPPRGTCLDAQSLVHLWASGHRLHEAHAPTFESRSHRIIKLMYSPVRDQIMVRWQSKSNQSSQCVEKTITLHAPLQETVFFISIGNIIRKNRTVLKLHLKKDLSTKKWKYLSRATGKEGRTGGSIRLGRPL